MALDPKIREKLQGWSIALLVLWIYAVTIQLVVDSRRIDALEHGPELKGGE